MSEVELISTLTCPRCGKQTTETMPEDSCLFFWECPHCEERIRPEKGDCCVFCSYGTKACPPVRKGKQCC